MLKFLRKYDKWILAIGGTLLMIAFVAPQAIQQVAGPSAGRVEATYAGGEITIIDRQQAAREIEIINRLGLGALGLIRSDSEDDDPAIHWILLNELARRAELVGGPDDGRDFLEYAARQVARSQASQYADMGTEEHRSIQDILVQLAMQQVEAAYDSLLAGGVMAPEELNMLLARARGVFRLYETYFEAAKLSDLEAIEAAREALDQVGVNYTILRATRVVPQAPRPEPEQFEEFFEKYKDVERGTRPHGFGYLYRPAVTLEWLHIERADIARGVVIDPVEANAYWRRNPDGYAEAWSEARPQVVADLRDQETDAILDEVNRVVAAEVRRGEGALPEPGEDGFRELPEDWALRRPSLTTVALRVQDMLADRYGIEIDRPNVIQLDQWFTRDGFSRLTGFETASLQVGPERVSTENAVFGVKDFDRQSPYPYQAGLIHGPAAADSTGDVFFFRVTDIRRRQPPESIDDEGVRTLVGQDIQKWNAYQMLLDWEERLTNMVVEGGLDAVSGEFAIEIEEEVAVSRAGVNPPQDFDFDQDFVREAILDHAERLNPKQLAINQPIEDRVLIVPLPYALAVAIIEIIDQRPVSQELFRQREPRAAMQAQSRLVVESPEDWPYSYSQLVRSMNLQWRDGRGDDPDAADGAPAQANAG